MFNSYRKNEKNGFLSRKTGYTILLLEIFYSSWEWLFLFSAAYFLTSIKAGGIISSVLFLLPSIIKVILAKPVARFITKFTSYHRLLSFWTRVALIILAGMLRLIDNRFSYTILLWMIITGSFSIINSYLMIDLRYLLAKNPSFPLGRTSAILNLGRRGTIAISTCLSLQLRSGDWCMLSHLLLVAMMAGTLSMAILILRAPVKQSSLPDSSQRHSYEISDNNSLQAISEVHRLSVLMFGLNLFFGLNNLLLIREIKRYDLYWCSLNAATLFYTGFILANIVTMIRPTVVRYFANWTFLCYSYIAVSLLTISYWIAKESHMMFFFLLIAFGIIYALQANALCTKISQTIFGENRAEWNAKIDSVGRIGFIVSYLLSGILLDRGVDSLLLSALQGCTALIALGVYLIVNRVSHY